MPMLRLCPLHLLFVLASIVRLHAAALPVADGYRGIWYSNQPSGDEYRYKYSGGFAVYPQQHIPFAVHCPEANKTFFVYGGTTARTPADKQRLLHMVSYYDHASGQVPRPRILLDKHTADAHDNPVLSIDGRGYLWIFSASHGTARPSFVSRSTEPYSIDEFDTVLTNNFSYPQPWFILDRGFVFLHTRYGGGRSLGVPGQRHLFWQTSADGRTWSEPRILAGIELGDYQISWPFQQRVGTAFDFHPRPVGLNARANLYYLETDDGGQQWRTITGRTIAPPLTNAINEALVYDSRKQGLLVYLKDLNYDAEGNPVILFLTSKGYESGPKNNPRTWHTLRWTGRTWDTQTVSTSDNNYDHGSLYIEEDGTWRVIAPTVTGPQPFNPGGEVVMLTSTDYGRTWTRIKQLTRDSPRNHTYVRRPLRAHPGFYAIWADGHGREPSESSLYFTDREGDHVWRLPPVMTASFAVPERL